MYSPERSPYLTQGQASTALPPHPRPGGVQARVLKPPQGQRTILVARTLLKADLPHVRLAVLDQWHPQIE